MSKDLRGTWIYFMPYLIPPLVGLGGTAAYVSSGINGISGFSLYLLVPIAQATAFWVLLAIVFCIYPFIDNIATSEIHSLNIEPKQKDLLQKTELEKEGV
ncbi:hypothetical protein MO867_18310 [Microbulbifer sp. OS29]|uniref:Uncharacterized protein n=1 Tax=Microbulbifer okhotskensis TaxID=2926617 RepID=A0A9X2EPY3_9GAMM|nr:hypothetical protein [Microbulbifer okhotskensis]MCO1336289.1 hypothetical protein [Microbulbifer okhotskensis]